MKLIKLLFIKYILSLSICIISSAVIFFIFSLIGNLDEEHLFNIIIKISFFNSLQILSYVPSFIFVISVILFIIFLRSKNEMIIIKSYINIRMLLIFTLPIVFFFTFIEINKNELVSFFEDTKTSLMDKGNQNSTKIIITRDNYSKSFIVLKNVNMNDLTQLEYRSYDVFKKKYN